MNDTLFAKLAELRAENRVGLGTTTDVYTTKTDFYRLLDILVSHFDKPNDQDDDEGHDPAKVAAEIYPDSPAYAATRGEERDDTFLSGRTRPPAVLRVLDDAEIELARAKEKFPLWPVDSLHAIAVVNEEVGELNKGLLQYATEPDKGITVPNLREEAIQSIAMLVRFVVALDNHFYVYPDVKQQED